MIAGSIDHNDADLEMSDTCVRNSLWSWVVFCLLSQLCKVHVLYILLSRDLCLRFVLFILLQ